MARRRSERAAAARVCAGHRAESWYRALAADHAAPTHTEETRVNLSAPTMLSFGISVVLAVLALLGSLGMVPALAGYAFWLAFGAWVVLALGALLPGF